MAAALISAIIAASAAGSKQRTGDSSTRARSAGVGRATAVDRAVPIWTTCEMTSMPSSPSSFLATAPAATRAAVSRALARSSTSRASVKPYFCMPARSAWPGRTWVSGAFGRARRRRHLLVPLVAAEPLGVLDLDGDRRAERAAVADAAEQRQLVLLEALARPAAVAEPAPGQLGLDVLDGDRQPGGRPSTITTSAWPCDSPAVRNRSIAARLPIAPRRQLARPVPPRPRRASPPGRGVTPVHSSCCSDRLVDEHPEPVDRRAHRRARAARSSAVLERVVDEVGDDLVGVQHAGSIGSSSRAHPDRRGVDDHVGGGDVVQRRRRRGHRRERRRLGRAVGGCG